MHNDPGGDAVELDRRDRQYVYWTLHADVELEAVPTVRFAAPGDRPAGNPKDLEWDGEQLPAPDGGFLRTARVLIAGPEAPTGSGAVVLPLGMNMPWLVVTDVDGVEIKTLVTGPVTVT